MREDIENATNAFLDNVLRTVPDKDHLDVLAEITEIALQRVIHHEEE